MKIITIIGARPQFIKAAPLSQALKDKGIEEFLLHTGQHYDPSMSDVFFEELGLKASDLNLHIHGGSHGQQTARMLEAIEAVLVREKPDGVLVYGDTNSTLAGALAAAKLHIPIFHVEAGLRSFNKKMPEEINRILADHLSNLLFAPTKTAIQNLQNEGFLETQVEEVGDVMYDATRYFAPLVAKRRGDILKRFSLKEKEYCIATIHRAENTDFVQRLETIFDALNQLSSHIKIILPIHPRIREKISAFKVGNNFLMIDPLGYLDMQALTQQSVCVLTDSGGLQKEAYFLGVPCMTLRDQTEWVELIESGWNKLVKIDETLSRKLLEELQFFKRRELPEQKTLYGEGNASQKIANSLYDYLQKNEKTT